MSQLRASILILLAGCATTRDPHAKPPVSATTAGTEEQVASTACVAKMCVIPQTPHRIEPFGPSHRRQKPSFLLSGDGRRAYTVGDDGRIRQWDTESGVLLETFAKGQGEQPPIIALSQDGTQLAAAGKERVRIWDTRSKRVTGDWPMPAWALASGLVPHWEHGLIWMHDGKHLVFDLPGNDTLLSVVEARTGRKVRGLETAATSDLAISPDGKTLLASYSESWQSIDLSSGRRLCNFPKTTAVAIVDARRLLAVDADPQMMSIWDYRACVVETGAALPDREKVKWWSSVFTTAHHFGIALRQDVDTRGTIMHLGQQLSEDGKKIAGLGPSNSLVIWDVAAKTALFKLQGNTAQALASSFDSDELLRVKLPGPAGDEYRRVDLLHGIVEADAENCGPKSRWRLKSWRGGELPVPIETCEGRLTHLPGSEGFEPLDTDACGNRFYVYHRTSKILRGYSARGEPKLEVEQKYSGEFDSRDGKIFPSCSGETAVVFFSDYQHKKPSQLSRFDLRTGAVSPIPGPAEMPMAVSPSTRWAAVRDPRRQELVNLFDLREPAEPRTLELGFRAHVAFSEGREEQLLHPGNAGLEIYDPASGRRVELVPLYGGAGVVAVSQSGKFASVVTKDGSLHVVRLDSRQVVSAVFATHDWALYTGEGYFEASHGGGALLGVRMNDRGYRIDQLAIKFNRPDKILAALGTPEPAAIEFFRKRHERRLEKLGIKSADLDRALSDAPAVELAELRASGTRANVALKLSGTANRIVEYSIYLNGVPVVTKNGAWEAGRPHAIEEVVELASGDNILEASAIDAGGVESLRPIRAHFVTPPQGKKPAVYFLGIGVSKYRDRRLDLSYAAKDARDLARAFEGFRGADQAVKTKILADQSAAKASLEDLKSFFADAGVDDLVVVFIAGHGAYGSDQRFYYLGHDADVTRLEATGVPFEELEGLLSETRARRRLLLIDTCESGAREETGAVAAVIPGKGRARAVRGLKIGGAKGSLGDVERRLLQQRTRYSFAELGRRSAAVVLSSARGDELSYELDELQNGVFTAALLRIFADPRTYPKPPAIPVEELRERARAFVVEKTGNLQHPTIDRNNPLADVSIPTRRSR